MECGLGGKKQSGLRIYFILFLDKFVLKAWVSRRVSYFVGSVLDGARYIFLPGCPQVLSMFFFLKKSFVFVKHRVLRYCWTTQKSNLNRGIML